MLLLSVLKKSVFLLLFFSGVAFLSAQLKPVEDYAKVQTPQHNQAPSEILYFRSQEHYRIIVPGQNSAKSATQPWALKRGFKKGRNPIKTKNVLPTIPRSLKKPLNPKFAKLLAQLQDPTLTMASLNAYVYRSDHAPTQAIKKVPLIPPQKAVP